MEKLKVECEEEGKDVEYKIENLDYGEEMDKKESEAETEKLSVQFMEQREKWDEIEAMKDEYDEEENEEMKVALLSEINFQANTFDLPIQEMYKFEEPTDLEEIRTEVRSMNKTIARLNIPKK